jgi:hypothetical protein
MIYDFEPYAAFCRLDKDGDDHLYTIDFYNFLRENDIKQFTMKDCQLMMQFYDLDSGGTLSYNEFLKFILPCDNTDIRAEACQRKTNIGKREIATESKRLHPSVEKTMAEFFERELNTHIKIEMLKKVLHS